MLSQSLLQAERDGSNEYSIEPGSLNTTDQLIKDLKNYDIVFHIGDMAYADGYLAEWDQFTEQVEPIASTVPYMVARFVKVNSSSHVIFHLYVSNQCCLVVESLVWLLQW